MSGGGENKVQRLSTTKKFFDKQRNPWGYVDEQLPTTTVKLHGPARRDSARAPRGTNAEGSYRITGSYQPDSEGTYSLRMTRLSVSAVGSPQASRGTVFQWHLRHSRQGTLMVHVLQPGAAQSGALPAADRVNLLGGPLNPIVSVGPGTLLWGWDTFKGELGTRVTLTQSMEAIPG